MVNRKTWILQFLHKQGRHGFTGSSVYLINQRPCKRGMLSINDYWHDVQNK